MDYEENNNFGSQLQHLQQQQQKPFTDTQTSSGNIMVHPVRRSAAVKTQNRPLGACT